MSGDDEDYTIENSDAGAALATPISAGELKKGGYMLIKGRPCKILSISVSKTGKHGHAKCNFETTDIFNGKKVMDMIPSTHGTSEPIVKKTEYELLNIDDDEPFFLNLSDESGEPRDDVKLPSYPEDLAQQIRDDWNEGENVVMVTVQESMGITEVVSHKIVQE